jgi:uncharacterized membrane protein (UPF0127 family)
MYTERTRGQWADLSTPRSFLRVLVADEPAERSKGLSHRDDIPGDGLLLQWDVPGRHPIWMAGMRFPLDLIWLERHGRVAGLLINVPVCSSLPCPVYEPAGTNQAIAVLELPAGEVANHGIKVGSEIRRSTSSSKAR